MAEAGPSSLQPGFPSATPSPASPSPQRSTRIHFPVDEARPNSIRSNSLGSIHSLGLGPPPVLKKSGAQGGSLPFQHDDKRRRVKSVDVPNGFNQSRSREGQLSSPSRRTMSISRRVEQRETMSKLVSTGLTETFSDEFDLSREDPGVLEDVQRALRLKARREARLRTQSSPLRVESHGTPDVVSLSSMSANSSPAPPLIAIPPAFPRQPRISGDSEIDFSPSVGVVSLHPVPSSSDDGLTLDWSSSISEEGRDRRWSLSKGKRKHREQTSFSYNKAAIDRQEALYASKLEQIRSTVQPQTQRKAAIIRDQLKRKYALLSSDSHQPAFSLLDVVRWYRRQDAKLRASLDASEPSTWMKHLWERHSSLRSSNSTWSPTACVVEEFIKSRSSPHVMDTIPENEVVLPISPNTASFSDTRSPTASPYSWNTPRHSLEAAISRKRSSYDAQVSFEPLMESGRDSVGGDSRRSSDNNKAWNHHGADSAQSSLYSIMSKGASPNNSRKRFRELGMRFTPRPSDENLSSARNSSSENSGHSVSEDGGLVGHQKMPTVRPHSRPSSLRLPSSPPPAGFDNRPSGTGSSDLLDAPSTATQSSTVFPSATEPTPRPEPASEHAIAPATFPRRRYRRSLPSGRDIFLKEREKRRRSANEHKEREEYEVKTHVLEDTLSQNYRMRHLLQRVCASVREYDSVQAGLSGLLGMSYSKIPSEVIDAFLHDPAGVTGGTRHVNSWRAVEDIHGRIRRQQEKLQGFLQSQLHGSEYSATLPKVFDNPIADLIHSLDDLAAQREDLVHRAEQVATVLKQVKGIQADVKRNYNDTLAHTSLVYPELSQIAALDENYRNQYQRFWDIGLDALTLLLDTVTPFWRNYGKVIGEDVQDFLIIPWYRNEFTGEPKRYPIERFPRRSFRHWVGLSFLSCLSVVVFVLQIRAAVSLTVHINLPWITYFGLRWIAIPIYLILLIIQWCAVIFEFCILAAQTGVIIWWIGWSVNLCT